MKSMCIYFFFFVSGMTLGILIDSYRESDTDYYKLLSCNSDTKIDEIVFIGQGEINKLSDDQSIVYLTDRFGHSEYIGMTGFPDHGMMYECTIKLSSGSDFKVVVYPGRNDKGIIVSEPLCNDDLHYYWVPFSDPVPDSVQKLFLRLSR